MMVVSAACWLVAGVRLVSRYLGRERMGEQRMTPPESPRDAPHNAGGQVKAPALSPFCSLLGQSCSNLDHNYIFCSILIFYGPSYYLFVISCPALNLQPKPSTAIYDTFSLDLRCFSSQF